MLWLMWVMWIDVEMQTIPNVDEKEKKIKIHQTQLYMSIYLLAHVPRTPCAWERAVPSGKWFKYSC